MLSRAKNLAAICSSVVADYLPNKDKDFLSHAWCWCASYIQLRLRTCGV